MAIPKPERRALQSKALTAAFGAGSSGKAACANPVWSPTTDEALKEQTIAAPKRRNVIGVLSGPAERVLAWAAAAPEHPHVHVEIGGIVSACLSQSSIGTSSASSRQGFGNRVMFGSDQMVWPGVIERAIEAIESAPFLSEAQKRDILYNAARFLRFTDADIAKHHRR